MRRALVGVALLAVGFGLALFAVRRELARSVDLREVAYVGSDACRRCHEDHHASWHRTFHRTMTREATAETCEWSLQLG